MKTHLFQQTVGSRMFGLDTDKSDVDMISVFIDPSSIFDANLKKTVVHKDEEGEVQEIELSTFMNLVKSKDLKIVEMLCYDTPAPEFISKKFKGFGILVEYANSLDMKDSLIKEIARRYNKTWYSQINPNAKNYNSTQGYDSKYAAHFYRVLMEAQEYCNSTFLYPCFVAENIREYYLDIKNGVVSKDEVFKLTHELFLKVTEELKTMDSKKNEFDFPEHIYFDVLQEVR